MPRNGSLSRSGNSFYAVVQLDGITGPFKARYRTEVPGGQTQVFETTGGRVFSAVPKLRERLERGDEVFMFSPPPETEDQ